MGLFDKLFGKNKDKTSEQQNDPLVAQAEDHVKRAIDIADHEISVTFSNGTRIIVGTSDTYMKIQTELEKAVKQCPSVPEYRYLLADAKINAGLRKDGREEIIKLAEQFPDLIEAQGFSKAISMQLNWFSPFQYFRWDTTMKKLPDGIIPADTGGCLPVTILRDGSRRIISFMGNIRRQSLGSNFHRELRTTLRLNFMKTPYATIVGIYVLIDTNPSEPYTSEQLINIEHYSSNSTMRESLDKDVGYYLIQLLASQPHTYIVINDPQEGVFFNRKLEISGKLASHLNDVATKVKKLKLCQQEDISVLQKANQYYFDHFSIDSVHF